MKVMDLISRKMQIHTFKMVYIPFCPPKVIYGPKIKNSGGTSLVKTQLPVQGTQWQGGGGVIPGGETKIPHAAHTTTTKGLWGSSIANFLCILHLGYQGVGTGSFGAELFPSSAVPCPLWPC